MFIWQPRASMKIKKKNMKRQNKTFHVSLVIEMLTIFEIRFVLGLFIFFH